MPKSSPLGMLAIAVLALGLGAFGTAAGAQCYVDYKAKQDQPLRLAYGVAQVSDAACNDTAQARAELEPRLAAAGWTLLKIISSFGPEGLDQRKASAGDFFLRY